MTPLSVSALNQQIKALLESHFMQVSVAGEIGRVTYHTSGHVYFNIKDEKSSLDGVMFRSNAAKLRFRLESGLRVIAHGGVSVYMPRGNYQILCTHIEPDGAGSLALAFEQLKKELAAKGYFDAARKKPLPAYPARVALVTSATGAALEDMRRVARRRWPLVQLMVVNVLVQGQEAARSIVVGLQEADALGADAVVVGRGGGSMEDLWSFNERAVAEAIYAMQTPVISAVGHEIDTVISDFVADVRAPTPSAAMEMLLPDIHEEQLKAAELLEALDGRLMALIRTKSQQLIHLKEALSRQSLLSRLQRYHEEMVLLKAGYRQQMATLLHHKARTLEAIDLTPALTARWHQKQLQTQELKEQMALADPAKRLPEKSAQLLLGDQPVRLSQLREGSEITLLDATHKARARIEAIARHHP